jgi:hypothetical protein
MKEKIIFNLKLAQIYAKDSDMEVALQLTRETITLLERLCNIRKGYCRTIKGEDYNSS